MSQKDWDNLSETSRLLQKRNALLSEGKKLTTTPSRKAVIVQYLEQIERDIDRLSYLRAEIKEDPKKTT
jgi:hypothetical protein